MDWVIWPASKDLKHPFECSRTNQTGRWRSEIFTSYIIVYISLSKKRMNRNILVVTWDRTFKSPKGPCIFLPLQKSQFGEGDLELESQKMRKSCSLSPPIFLPARSILLRFLKIIIRKALCRGKDCENLYNMYFDPVFKYQVAHHICSLENK